MSEQEQNQQAGGSSFTDYIFFWRNPEVKEQCEYFNKEIAQPVRQQYSELPKEITQFKQEYIFSNFSQNIRMIGLILGSFVTGTVSRKMGSGFLKSTRNSGFAFFGLGVFFLPEVFNPYVHVPNIVDCDECNTKDAAASNPATNTPPQQQSQ